MKHVAYIGEMGNVHEVLEGKHECKRPGIFRSIILKSTLKIG
jgi:hypothetical protein